MPFFWSLGVHLEGVEAKVEEARAFLEQLYNSTIMFAQFPCWFMNPPPILFNPLSLPLSPLPLAFSPLGGLAPTNLQPTQCMLYLLAPCRSLRLQLRYASLPPRADGVTT
jgi:hypothetical protein